jgi:hypothetical protein
MRTKFDLHLRYYAPPITDWQEVCWTCVDDLTNDYDSRVGIGPTPLAAIVDYYDQIVEFDNVEIAPGFMHRLPSGEEDADTHEDPDHE